MILIEIHIRITAILTAAIHPIVIVTVIAIHLAAAILPHFQAIKVSERENNNVLPFWKGCIT